MHKMQVAGAEVLVKQIIERLGDQIEATIFCLDDVGELGYQLRDQGVPVIVLDRKPGFDAKVPQRMAGEIRDRGIQILHAHQYTPFFYSALARLRHRAKAKILFTEHGRHYPDVISWKRHIANRWLLNRYADITTACCDFSTKALREIEGFPDAFTLANGVDLAELPPRGNESERNALRQTLGLDPDRPYAACIARFHIVKDHATLIRAWARVHQKLPEAQLLLVGDGEERQNIETLIDDLQRAGVQALAATPDRNATTPPQREASASGASPQSPKSHPPLQGGSSAARGGLGVQVSSPESRVVSQESGNALLNGDNSTQDSPLTTHLSESIRFLGIRDDVGDILRAVDVFTLTSVSEAASLTLLEAMASECPSVVTDVGGNSEHLRQGIDGYLVPRADDTALAGRLLELLNDPSLAHQFGQSARQQVQQHFNLSGAVDKYHELYQQLACVAVSC
ncbi:Putative glycosyltransferase EpsD [Stieleria neptunia]|uniref:Glycosyltransferase EpsD n=1 Tax=Stieleria neptunia TaxID=2527979 RepID=A0A518HR04_9BACT|nr:glycosyltransferase [Stieleria neptunia]QDV43218.1 Putative glycosyltransferase EpsD [Stieleria neptunia]